MNMVPAEATSCPSCGFNGSQQNPEISLSIGYRLNNRYVVGSMKDSDGDSVTYIGYDVQFGKKVEICEFLPMNGCSRNKETGMLIPKPGAELHYKTSLMDFSDLFRNLNKLTYEDGLVKTIDYFEANQTAYAILEFFDAVTLREFLGLKSGIISWDQCNTIMQPVFNAINSIHSVNLTHRGVSPETILVSRSGEIKLSGFATTSVRTKGTDVASKLFAGYSAPEQYSTTMWQSTATDVYGLAATIYRCITGTAPQEADQRRVYDNLVAPIELNSTIPTHVSRAIMIAMLVDQQERTQTILGFRQQLAGAPEEKPAQRAERIVDEEEYYDDSYNDAVIPFDDGDYEDDQQVKKEKTLRLIAIIAAGCFVLMLAIYLLLGAIRGKTPGTEGEGPTIVEKTYEVPNYIGQNINTAELDVINFGFVIEAKYDENEEEGKILSSSPSPNTVVEKGASITLYVNMPRVITMVDFEGLSQKNAEALLEELGVPKSNYEFKTEETTQGLEYTVYKQSIEPDEEFNVNVDTLVLTVAVRPQEN